LEGLQLGREKRRERALEHVVETLKESLLQLIERFFVFSVALEGTKRLEDSVEDVEVVLL